MASRTRLYKVAERIRTVIAMQLLQLGDPRFSLVTIVSVSVSNDMRNAKVYWTASNAADRLDEINEAFAGAASSFKRKIAQELGTRFVPDLRFYYDDTLDVLEKTEKLMEEVKKSDAER